MIRHSDCEIINYKPCCHVCTATHTVLLAAKTPSSRTFDPFFDSCMKEGRENDDDDSCSRLLSSLFFSPDGLSVHAWKWSENNFPCLFQKERRERKRVRVWGVKVMRHEYWNGVHHSVLVHESVYLFLSVCRVHIHTLTLFLLHECLEKADKNCFNLSWKSTGIITSSSHVSREEWLLSACLSLVFHMPFPRHTLAVLEDCVCVE